MAIPSLLRRIAGAALQTGTQRIGSAASELATRARPAQGQPPPMQYSPPGFGPPMRTSSAPMGPRQAMNLLQQQRPFAQRPAAMPPGFAAQPGLGLHAAPGTFPPPGFAGSPGMGPRAPAWPAASTMPPRVPARPAPPLRAQTWPPTASTVFGRPGAILQPAAQMHDWAGPVHQHAQRPASPVDQGILRQNFAKGSAHQVSNPLSDGVVPLARPGDWQPQPVPRQRRNTIAESNPASRMSDWAGPVHQEAQRPAPQVDQGILRQGFAQGSAHQVSNPLSDGVVPLAHESDWQPPGFG